MRQPIHHHIKCWPAYFGEVWACRKRFEYREDDQDYQLQDEVTLQEWDPAKQGYTGRKFHMGTIDYIARDGLIPKDYCIFNCHNGRGVNDHMVGAKS